MNIGESYNLQLAIFLIAFIGIVISVITMIKHKDKIGWVIPPLTFFINVFLFNTYLHLTVIYGVDILTSQAILIWSATLRLHALLLGIAYVIVPIRSRITWT